jgi:hypothetical protein
VPPALVVSALALADGHIDGLWWSGGQAPANAVAVLHQLGLVKIHATNGRKQWLFSLVDRDRAALLLKLYHRLVAGGHLDAGACEALELAVVTP